VSHTSWGAAYSAARDHFYGTPPPLPQREQDAAVQFYEDGVSVAEDLLSDLQHCLAKARDGDLGPPHAGKGEEMLTELMRWAAEAKHMRKGEI
jgi:hypothetical protein